MTSPALLASLRAAVAAAPDDLQLRLHLAEMLVEAGERDEAVQQAAAVLQQEPGNATALSIIRGGGAPATPPPTVTPAPTTQATPQPSAPRETDVSDEQQLFKALEEDLSDVLPSRYTDGADPYGPADAGVRLADVGGMTEVKARLEAAFLAPLRNPELVKLYGKSLRGGLLLYGPPGCGKTFLARAVAGEMGARFLSVSLADVLDMYIGQSERNIHELFESARRAAPCVLFFDEIDAIGQKRSQMHNNAGRGAVNQLLTEMDGVQSANDGVYILGATNHPWDVDVALRRPGRFDRMVLVAPPDGPAREAILRYHLRDRPIAGVDVAKLAKGTEGYSGADLAYVCERAAEMALLDSARSGTIRMIDMNDLEAAAADVRPSTGPWMETARNVAQFANEGGAYDELLAYLRSKRLL